MDSLTFSAPSSANQFGMVITRMDISKIRARFAEMLGRAEAGEIVIVTRRGKDVAAMVPANFYAVCT